jgi:ATP-dependent Clp protease adaptor protein ClpS
MLPARATMSPQPPGTSPVAEPVEQTDIEPEHLSRLVLIDDNEHTYEYVIEMLGAVFGYGPEKAFALARLVDTQGRVTLMTGSRADCEAKQSQVHAYGADPRIPTSKGSMTAIVEDAGTAPS